MQISPVLRTTLVVTRQQLEGDEVADLRNGYDQTRYEFDRVCSAATSGSIPELAKRMSTTIPPVPGGITRAVANLPTASCSVSAIKR